MVCVHGSMGGVVMVVVVDFHEVVVVVKLSDETVSGAGVVEAAVGVAASAGKPDVA